jgi:hypothetical protein
MTSDQSSLVGNRVQRDSDRAFTGRAAELAMFRAALSGRDGALPCSLCTAPEE